MKSLFLIPLTLGSLFLASCATSPMACGTKCQKSCVTKCEKSCCKNCKDCKDCKSCSSCKSCKGCKY